MYIAPLRSLLIPVVLHIRRTDISAFYSDFRLARFVLAFPWATPIGAFESA